LTGIGKPSFVVAKKMAVGHADNKDLGRVEAPERSGQHLWAASTWAGGKHLGGLEHDDRQIVAAQRQHREFCPSTNKDGTLLKCEQPVGLGRQPIDLTD
jgi:hypothetical protein